MKSLKVRLKDPVFTVREGQFENGNTALLDLQADVEGIVFYERFLILEDDLEADAEKSR